ncbi:nuclear transport factor 2 family protein [Streptomyces sp. NPDC051320]|uniref:nuclear transport factor 2 family protein n=1 Tax=Streptomyces sp. NPDC051320 TaxID=3154644 RepID=UPI0034391FCA
MIETLIRTHVEAFNTHDLDTLMAGFTEDAVWVTGRTTARGRAELTELFAGAMEGLLPTLTVQHLIVGEDRAACQMVETFTFDGAELTDHIAGFYDIAHGRIAAAKIYREGSADIG